MHPWYGYEEESIPATVSTIEALRQVVSDKLQRSDFKLYYSPLKGGGPIFKSQHELSANAQLADVVTIGCSKVFYTIGASPKTSPKKEKPKSPFIKHAGIGISFGELPVLFRDKAVQDVVATISSTAVDRRTVLLFAMPGSGKTRTIREAAKNLSCTYHRVKLNNDSKLIRDLRQQASAAVSYLDRSATYDDCKRVFHQICDDAMKEDYMDKAFTIKYEPRVVEPGGSAFTVVQAQMKD